MNRTRYAAWSHIFGFGEVRSIFMRSVTVPSSHIPQRISSNSCRLSSTGRSRHGDLQAACQQHKTKHKGMSIFTRRTKPEPRPKRTGSAGGLVHLPSLKSPDLEEASKKSLCASRDALISGCVRPRQGGKINKFAA